MLKEMTQEEIDARKHGEKTETVYFANKVPVEIFSFRRHKHDFEKGWETKYLTELINTLKEGMIVFDIGAEQGEFTAMAAKIVGGENVHIFEPSESYWYNIKKVWESNNLEYPAGLFGGFVSDTTTNIADSDFKKMWESDGDVFYGTNQVTPQEAKRPSVTLDDYCLLNLIPDVVMMDIEGAELSAIKGAEKIINAKPPIFFISIHSDDLIFQRSGGNRKDIHEFFNKHGYTGKHINTDHEEHWKFEKVKA